jgi:transcriptional regulator with XRE-family HTH domain
MRLDEALGEVLRAARKHRGLTQEELALDARVERNYVSLIELGRHSISIRIFAKICRVLDIAPSALLGRAEEQMRTGTKRRSVRR